MDKEKLNTNSVFWKRTIIIMVLTIILLILLFVIITTLRSPNLIHYAGNKVEFGSQIEIDPFKRVDWIISFFGALLTAVILGFSIITLIIQKNYNEENKRLFENEEKRIEKNFQEQKKHLDLEIERYRITATLEESIKKEIQRLFEEKFMNDIFSYTRTFTKESLLLLPQYKEILYLINERTIRQFVESLKECCNNDDVINRITDILLTSNYQISAISRLFYTLKDKEGEQEIKNGLDDIIAKPCPEIKDYLIKMKTHYHESTILPLIVRAIEAIELIETKTP